MIERLWKDPVLTFLLQRSFLTAAQLDTILAAKTEQKLQERVALRAKRVTKGAFLRTLRQGQRNVQSSVYTLLLIRYTHLIDSGTWVQLVRMGELMDKASSAGVSEGEGAQFVALVKEFVSAVEKR